MKKMKSKVDAAKETELTMQDHVRNIIAARDAYKRCLIAAGKLDGTPEAAAEVARATDAWECAVAECATAEASAVRYPIVVSPNITMRHDICAICCGSFDPEAYDYMLAGTDALVCESCATEQAPDLVHAYKEYIK